MKINQMIHFPGRVIRFIKRKLIPPDKYQSEMSFWKDNYRSSGRKIDNRWYTKVMLQMAGVSSASFVRGKVLADFGCGPHGSLEWAAEADECIGIDVLADKYGEYFDFTGHNMRYITCSETEIPLPDNSVDILFTLNAMDHAFHFDLMSSECLRILKPGGEFIGEFNLNEPPSVCEPQMLTESMIQDNILNYLEKVSCRLTKKGKPGSHFRYLFENEDLPAGTQTECMLWVRGYKKL